MSLSKKGIPNRPLNKSSRMFLNKIKNRWVKKMLNLSSLKRLFLNFHLKFRNRSSSISPTTFNRQRSNRQGESIFPKNSKKYVQPNRPRVHGSRGGSSLRNAVARGAADVSSGYCFRWRRKPSSLKRLLKVGVKRDLECCQCYKIQCSHVLVLA